MTDEASELPPELSSLDPVLGDRPPAVGSSRYESILERAMTTDESVPDVMSSNSRSPRIWPVRVLVAAAAVVLLAVGIMVVGPFGKTKPASAAEQIAAAAKKIGDVTTLRAHGLYTDNHGDGSHSLLTIDSELDGADYYRVLKGSATADRPASASSETVIGDRKWTTEDGHATETSAGPASQRNAPFPIASRAVVTAALTGSVIVSLGSGTVRGVQATHFKITLTERSRDALSKLPANQLSAFELEYPQNVKSFDVWVANGLIHKISIFNSYGVGENAQVPANGSSLADETTSSLSVIEFYDLGSDITIKPPE